MVAAAGACAESPDGGRGGETAVDSAALALGADLYSQCAVCHESDGTGLAGVYPPLAGSEVVNGPPGVLIKIVLGGLEGPITVKGETFDGVMPPFGGGPALTDAETAALLTYVRASFGNRGGAVRAEDVASERSASAGRVALWTAAELGLR